MYVYIKGKYVRFIYKIFIFIYNINYIQVFTYKYNTYKYLNIYIYIYVCEFLHNKYTQYTHTYSM